MLAFTFEPIMPIMTPHSNPCERGTFRRWRPHLQPAPTTRPGPCPFLSRIGITRRDRSKTMSSSFKTNSTTSNSNTTNSRNRSIRCKGVGTKPRKPPANRPHLIHLLQSLHAPNVTRHRANGAPERAIRVPALLCLRRLRCNPSILRRVPVDMASLPPRRFTIPIR